MQYRRRRRSTGVASIVWCVAWLAGIATVLALFWFFVPRIILVQAPDGSLQSIQIDWTTTTGKALWRQLERARNLDDDL